MNRTTTTLTLLLLLLTLSLTVKAQYPVVRNPVRPQPPLQSGQINLYQKDSAGFNGLMYIPKVGPVGILPIDPAQVTGLNNSLSSISSAVATGLSTRPTLSQTLDSLNFRTAQNKTIAGLRASSYTGGYQPRAYQIVDRRREGTFLYDPTDTTTPDNGGTCLVDGNGRRYKRQYTGPIDVRWFGALGIRSVTTEYPSLAVIDSLNTAGIQAAIDAASLSSGQSSIGDGIIPNNKGVSNTVLIPAGTYFLTTSLKLRGAVNLMGQFGESGSYGGVILTTRTAGINIIELAPSPMDGISNASTISYIRFYMSNGTEANCIYAAPGYSYSSLRVTKCWFQIYEYSPHEHIYTGVGDDVHFEECTIDGTGADYAFVLGTATTPTGTPTGQNAISNFAFQNGTIYRHIGPLIKAVNVDGLLFSGNRVYSSPDRQGKGIVDAVSNSVRGDRIQITNNLFRYENLILSTLWDKALIAGNSIENATGRIFQVSSAATSGHRIEGNIISGTFSGTVSIAGIQPDAPIFSPGAVITNSYFNNTIVDNNGTGTTAYYLTNSSGNVIVSDNVSGFTTVANTATADVTNLHSLKSAVGGLGTMATQNSGGVAITGGNLASVAITGSSFAGTANINGGNITSVAITGSSIPLSNVTGAGTAASQPSTAFMPASSGFVTPVFSNTITATSAWTSAVYNELMPENTLQAGRAYLLQIRFVKSGTDQSTHVYNLPMELGWSGYGTHPDLTGVSNYYASPTRGFKVRLKTTTGNNTPGLEGTLMTADMQGATVTIKIIPLI